MKNILILLFTIFFFQGLEGQNVAINNSGSEPHTKAILDIQSTNKGILIPRMSTNQRMDISPLPEGLLVYDMDKKDFMYVSNEVWNTLGNAGAFEKSLNLIKSVDGYEIDNFVFGSPSLNSDGNAAHRKRLFFNKSLGAFRVGEASGLQWNTDSLGLRSFATGFNTSAVGTNAVAFGNSSKASGDQSFATGASPEAIGDMSSAMGSNTKAKGLSSMATGWFTKSDGSYAASFGQHTISKSVNEVSIGRYNDTTVTFNTTSWNGSDQLFSIGNGQSQNQRSNALTVLKDGRIGIGTSTPDPSSIMDMSTSEKGLLIPQMKSSARINISSPKEGLLVYDQDTRTFWYVTNNVWKEIETGSTVTTGTKISDADGDTFIDTESTLNNDTIRMHVAGLEVAKIDDKTFHFKSPNESLFIGENAGLAHTTGIQNVLLGYQAGEGIQNASYNVAVGYQALMINRGNRNTAIGYHALRDGFYARDNVAIGYEAMSNSKAEYNIAIGKRAMKNADFSTDNNIAIGENALENCSDGDNNIAIGKDNLRDNTGFNNVAIGVNALNANTEGDGNIGIGRGALVGVTEGNNNVGIGISTNAFNPLGNDNVMIGHNAGAGFGVHENNRCVFLGFHAGKEIEGNDLLFIENTNATTPLIWGNFASDRVGINHVATANTLEVGGNASKVTAGSWLANSDRRIKTDIQDIENSVELLKKLRPVKFKYTEEWKAQNPSIKDQYYYNFIAQEYEEVFPESVQGSGQYLENDAEEIRQVDTYNAQIVTIKAVQELLIEVENLKKEIALLKENNTVVKTSNLKTN